MNADRQQLESVLAGTVLTLRHVADTVHVPESERPKFILTYAPDCMYLLSLCDPPKPPKLTSTRVINSLHFGSMFEAFQDDAVLQRYVDARVRDAVRRDVSARASDVRLRSEVLLEEPDFEVKDPGEVLSPRLAVENGEAILTLCNGEEYVRMPLISAWAAFYQMALTMTFAEKVVHRTLDNFGQSVDLILH